MAVYIFFFISFFLSFSFLFGTNETKGHNGRRHFISFFWIFSGFSVCLKKMKDLAQFSRTPDA
jgi:hypothetical protein